MFSRPGACAICPISPPVRLRAINSRHTLGSNLDLLTTTTSPLHSPPSNPTPSGRRPRDRNSAAPHPATSTPSPKLQRPDRPHGHACQHRRSTLRVHLSNAFGTAPLVVGSAHIALRDKDSAIIPTSDHALTFNGKPSITIPIGAEWISDPVALTLAPLAELTISVYVPGDSGAASTHSLGLHTTWVKSGDATAATDLADGEKLQAWYWVSGVDVQAPADSVAIVALGDSITDGATSTPDTDSSWPSVLSPTPRSQSRYRKDRRRQSGHLWKPGPRRRSRCQRTRPLRPRRPRPARRQVPPHPRRHQRHERRRPPTRSQRSHH